MRLRASFQWSCRCQRAATYAGVEVSAVGDALVEGWHEADCSAMLHKGREGCDDSWLGSYEVCVIDVSTWVHCRVRGSDGLKGVLHQCEGEGPEGTAPSGASPSHTLRADVMSMVPDSLSEKKRTVK
jgi:hypothetical protein